MKKKSYMFSLVVTFVLSMASVAFAFPAHTFHTSLMQVEYNQEQQLVEISIQVFSDDLERVLSRRSGKNVRIDRSPEADKLTLVYLNEAVILKNHGHVETLSWVGMQRQSDTVWLYLEMKLPEGFEGLEIRNRIMFDLFDDQINLVHIKFNEKKYDLVFKPGDDFKVITETPRGAK